MRRDELAAVARRELIWLFTDRLARFTLIGISLIALGILSWTFSRPVIRDLAVAVVDADRSPTSTVFAEAIDASPSLAVTWRFEDLAAAARAIRSGETIAAVYIPPDFENELLNGRRPQIVLFDNNQYLTPGSAAASGMRSAAAAAVDNANRFALTQFLSGTGAPLVTAGPLEIRQNVLGNTSTNYAEYLLRAFAPTVLHIIFTVIAAYSMAREFQRRNGVRDLLAVAGGSVATAIAGKMLPLLAIGMTFLLAFTAFQNAAFGLTVKGSVLLITLANAVFLVAYMALGMLCALLYRDTASALGLVGICVSPAFGFAGVGMPILAMGTFAKSWSALLPLRWYLKVLFDQATRGIPVAESVPALGVLSCLAGVLVLAVLLRLRSMLATGKVHAPVEDVAAPASCRATVGAVMVTEWRRIFADRAVLSFFLSGPLIYGVFYPQPYLGEVTRDIPIAIVDNEDGAISHRLIQALDASETIAVAVRRPTLAEARADLDAQRVFAVIEIPAGTTRDVMRGNVAPLPLYIDGSYFSIFSKALAGVMDAVLAEDADRLAFSGRQGSGLVEFALARASPAEILSEPLYNPTGGYASYAVPAAFVLIVQQMLLFGAAGMRPLRLAPRHSGAAGRIAAALACVTGRTLAQVLMMIPATLFLLVVMIRVYGFGVLGGYGDLCLMLVPFLLATSLMGQAVGWGFKTGYGALILLVSFGIPLFFLAGAAWPQDQIPDALWHLALVFPSTVAIDGIVRINQMGATLHEVATTWWLLWGLAGAYFTVALLQSMREPQP